MDYNNTGDDIIEIVPDEIPEEDQDIKIMGNAGEHGKETNPENTDSNGEEEYTVNIELEDVFGESGNTESSEETASPDKPEESSNTDSFSETGRLENPEKSSGTGSFTVAANQEKPEETGNTDIPGETGNTEKSEDTSDPADLSTSKDTGKTGDTCNPEDLKNDGNAVGSIYTEDDDFSEEFYEIEHEQQDYEIMEEIGDSIIKQMEGLTRTEKDEAGDGEENDPDGDDPDNTEGVETDSETSDDGEKDVNPLLTFFRKIPKWGYAIIGSALILTCFMLWMTMSAAGQSILIKLGSKWIAGKFTYQPVTQVDEIDYLPDEDPENPEDPSDITGIPDVPDNFEVVTPGITEEPTPVPEEKTVYNLLLIGEENIDSSSSRGRSDLIMVASINREQGKVKLISILRDILVAIPNHSDNRINAAYTIGGVSLLYDTLKANLGIEFDNYCLVNFDSFEKIVDAIGGIDVDLTAEEAAYLNKTNYISKPEFRNVSVGHNRFNGNQTLGYCRIRKVPTADLQYSDIGRTSRQRRLMRQIFERVNKMNNVEMMSFVNNCIPYLTTDLTSEQLEHFILMFNEMGTVGFEELRLPVDGSYHDAKLRGMLVTQIDLTQNSEALHSFIYGIGE